MVGSQRRFSNRPRPTVRPVPPPRPAPPTPRWSPWSRGKTAGTTGPRSTACYGASAPTWCAGHNGNTNGYARSGKPPACIWSPV